MATIFERKYPNKPSVFRVTIRRKDIPLLCLSFDSFNEAKDWIEENEEAYINEPQLYLKSLERKRLELRRNREFKNKKD